MNEPIYIINRYGTKVWKDSNGQYHRTDGPAIEWVSGYKEWYFHGLRHRTDGPAIEYSDGSKAWYIHNECHRADGPAVEWANGKKEYWYKGELITKKIFYSKEFQVRMVMES